MKPYLRIDRPEDKPAAWRTSALSISATKGTARMTDPKTTTTTTTTTEPDEKPDAVSVPDENDTEDEPAEPKADDE